MGLGTAAEPDRGRIFRALGLISGTGDIFFKFWDLSVGPGTAAEPDKGRIFRALGLISGTWDNGGTRRGSYGTLDNVGM